MKNNIFDLVGTLNLRNLSAGSYISKGIGKHVTRTIDSYEIIYVKSGVLGIFEEDIFYEVKAGQALILFPHRRHGGTKPFAKDLVFYWLHFDIDAPSEQQEHLLHINQLTTVINTANFIQYFRQYIKCYQNNWVEYTKGSLTLFQILLELHNSQVYESKLSASQVLATKAHNYIATHMEEELSVQKIANALNCNSDYLGKIYLGTFQKTITKSIQELRIQKSCYMLLETSYNINEIAKSCGFDASDQFRKVFRQFHGETPKEYRKKYSILDSIGL